MNCCSCGRLKRPRIEYNQHQSQYTTADQHHEVLKEDRNFLFGGSVGEHSERYVGYVKIARKVSVRHPLTIELYSCSS